MRDETPKSPALLAIDDEIAVSREAIQREAVVLDRMQGIHSKLLDVRDLIAKAERNAEATAARIAAEELGARNEGAS